MNTDFSRGDWVSWDGDRIGELIRALGASKWEVREWSIAQNLWSSIVIVEISKLSHARKMRNRYGKMAAAHDDDGFDW